MSGPRRLPLANKVGRFRLRLGWSRLARLYLHVPLVPRFAFVRPQQHVRQARGAVIGQFRFAPGNPEKPLVALSISIDDGVTAAEQIATCGGLGKL